MQKINFTDSLKSYFKNCWWKFIIIFAVLAVDLVTKSLIVPSDESLWHVVPILGEILVISPTRNVGAGFSILSGKTVFLIVLTIVFIIALACFDIFSKRKSKLLFVATALIMAGALGNFIDRILFSYVRDFIYLKFINFPVFNVADISLTVGVVLLFVYIIFYSSKDNMHKTDVDISK